MLNYVFPAGAVVSLSRGYADENYVFSRIRLLTPCNLIVEAERFAAGKGLTVERCDQNEFVSWLIDSGTCEPAIHVDMYMGSGNTIVVNHKDAAAS